MQLKNVPLTSFLPLFSAVLNCIECLCEQDEVKDFTVRSESLFREGTGGKACLLLLINDPYQKFSRLLFLLQTDIYLTLFDLLTAGHFLIGE